VPEIDAPRTAIAEFSKMYTSKSPADKASTTVAVKRMKQFVRGGRPPAA
jgi:hypothetical protein